MKATLLAPRIMASGNAAHKPGEAASAIMETPKAKAPSTTICKVTRWRRAVPKAPINDPTLSTDYSSVKVWGFPWRLRTTNNGSTT